MNTLHLLFRFNLCCLYLIATLVFIVDVQADEDVHAFDRERFQQALDKLHEQYNFPGATAAVVLPDGTCTSFATGMADLEQAIQMKPETRILPASIGKTFVAVVALSLVQEGKLGLDDKITE